MDGMVKAISVAGRGIGPGHPCFIVAEAGVNHNGELEKAFRLVDTAVRAGADAVKFQTFTAEQLATCDAPKAGYQVEAMGSAESQFEMLRRLELSAQAHHELLAYSRQQGIMFISTPFGEDSADLLNELGVAVFKIASGEITNLPFLAHVARKGKPLIISTGMSTLDEVEAAVRVVRDAGSRALVLLHCVSNYPARPSNVNLRAMETMAAVFRVPVGYSDHTTGIEVALAAVALGACVLEKHVTLDRNLPGPDHQTSLEPSEFAALVSGIRTVERALGSGRKEPAPSEAETAAVARKSIVAARYIPAGSKLTEEMLAVKRPGTGLSPAMRSQLPGRVVSRDIPAGTLLTLDMMA